MLSLVLKDILIQKKNVLISILYIVVFIFAFQGAGNGSISAGIVAVTYMLISTASAYDDKNKCDVVLNSLPIARWEIVVSKYLSIFVYAAIGIIAYIITAFIITGFNIPLKVYSLTFEALIGGLFAIVLLNGIYLPVYFRFGYVKAKMVNFILFFVFFFGVMAGANFLKENQDTPIIKALVTFLMSGTDVQIALAIISLMILIFLISCLLSIKFYKNREF